MSVKKIVAGDLQLFVRNSSRTELKRNSWRALREALWALDHFVGLKGRKRVETTLTLCGLRRITSLNRNYRAKNKSTDVLSFPLHECRELSKLPLDMINLGDIFICQNVARRQAANFGISFEQELIHLFIHGFLHLLSYDHEKSSEMERLEKRLVKLVYKRLGHG